MPGPTAASVYVVSENAYGTDVSPYVLLLAFGNTFNANYTDCTTGISAKGEQRNYHILL